MSNKNEHNAKSLDSQWPSASLSMPKPIWRGDLSYFRNLQRGQHQQSLPVLSNEFFRNQCQMLTSQSYKFNLLTWDEDEDEI